MGPIYNIDKNPQKLLENCYINALKIADKYKISSIGFPAISTGIFGYPIKEAAEVSIKAIIKSLSYLISVRVIRVILYNHEFLELFDKYISKLNL